MIQHLQALAECRPAIAHIRSKALHSLNVVRIHIQSTLGHNLDHVQVTAEVSRQSLDKQCRLLLLNLANRLCKVSGTAVGQIIAVHARQHNVAKAPSCQCFGGVFRLMGIQRSRCSVRLDAAEAASSRACVAHEHDGGRGGILVGTAPALGDVGTPRLFTDGV